MRRFPMLFALALALAALRPAAAVTLAPGDIIVTDINLNAVYRVEANGTRTILSSGQGLDSPRGVVVDATGKIFVTESSTADAVLRIDPSKADGTAGNQLFLTDPQVFSSPRGIVISTLGDFLVVEADDDTIYRVHPASGLLSVFSQANGAEETFHFPGDLAREADGGVLVTDAPSGTSTLNNRLLRVAPGGGPPTVLLKGAPMAFPRGIAIEATGNAVIADSGATTPSVIAPSLIRIGLAFPPALPASIIPVIGGLQGPRGIAVDASGNLLVTDFTAKAVYRIDPTTGVRTTLTSDPSLGPWAITVVTGPVASIPPSSLLVVDADGSQRTIKRVTPDGLATSTTSLVAPVGSLIAPVAVAKTRNRPPWNGKILVADAGAVRAIDAAQNVTTVSEGGWLSNVTGLVVDAADDVIVTDANANAVIRIKPNGVQSIIGTAGGDLTTPVGLVIDRDGLLVVAVRFTAPLVGARGRLLRMNPGDGARRVINESLLFHTIRSLALDATGDVLIADDVPVASGSPQNVDSVLRLDARFEDVSLVAASQTEEPGALWGVVADADGNLIFSNDPTIDEDLPQELRRFDPLQPNVQTLFSTGEPFAFVKVRGIALDAEPPVFPHGYPAVPLVADPDVDLIGSSVDNCATIANFEQADNEFDNIGDVCDGDDDNDGDLDSADNCPFNFNDTQLDSDGDGRGNTCDNCPNAANPGWADLDNDGMGDVCDTDDDADGDLDAVDNCPGVPNADQLNTEKPPAPLPPLPNADDLGDACDDDDDGDGDLDTADNCRLIPNSLQEDGDGDGDGDACDNCPAIANSLQENSDVNAGNKADTKGDACDADDDGDGRCDVAGVSDPAPFDCNQGPDNCRTIANPNQQDNDSSVTPGFPGGLTGPDGIGNPCDNCASVYNPGQENVDADLQGDVCDTDIDNDQRLNTADNCTHVSNFSQVDTNKDGYGNICDADFDASGTAGSGVVGVNDVTAIAGRFGLPATGIEEFDLDSSGAIGIGDVTRAAGAFGKAPGPSGYSCAGTPVPECPVPPPTTP